MRNCGPSVPAGDWRCAGITEQLGAQSAVSVGLLVNVHDFGEDRVVLQPAGPSTNQADKVPCQVAGSLGTSRKHAGVHFHTTGDTDQRQPVSASTKHVPSRAVATRKKDKACTGPSHRSNGCDRVA